MIGEDMSQTYIIAEVTVPRSLSKKGCWHQQGIMGRLHSGISQERDDHGKDGVVFKKLQGKFNE